MKTLTEYDILQNYGYNRDYNNNCISETIEEDIIYLLKECKETVLYYIDLYLSDAFGKEYIESKNKMLSLIKTTTKNLTNDNIHIMQLSLMIAYAIYADSIKHYTINTLVNTMLLNKELTLSYKDDILNLIKTNLEE